MHNDINFNLNDFFYQNMNKTYFKDHKYIFNILFELRYEKNINKRSLSCHPEQTRPSQTPAQVSPGYTSQTLEHLYSDQIYLLCLK